MGRDRQRATLQVQPADVLSDLATLLAYSPTCLLPSATCTCLTSSAPPPPVPKLSLCSLVLPIRLMPAHVAHCLLEGAERVAGLSEWGGTIIKSYTLFRPLRCESHSYNSSTGAVSRSRTTGQRHRQPCDDARTLPAWDPSGYSAIIQADRFSPPPFLVVPGILFGPADPTKLALGSLLSLPPLFGSISTRASSVH